MPLHKELIERVAINLPDLPERPRKNLYDILGVQYKETINSRVLAYFLDPNEDHGFGSLFFDSLLEVVSDHHKNNEELKNYSGEFKVFTEEATIYAKQSDQRQKRIDISIIGENWYIIIENKLYHHMKNPLKAYWEHAESKNHKVMGILLTLDKIPRTECIEKDIEFLNLTHQDWINQIQADLVLGNIENDTDLFYLREYIKTIKSHQQDKMDAPQMNALVRALLDQREDINEIEAKKAEAVKFINQQIVEVFSERGYNLNRQWYCHPEDENLRFYVISARQILKENYIAFGYEVYNTLKDVLGDTISEIHTELKEKITDPHFYFDDSTHTNNMSRIITYRHKNFLAKGVNFKDELAKILDTYFFSKNGIEKTTLDLLPEKIKLKPAKEYQG